MTGDTTLCVLQEEVAALRARLVQTRRLAASADRLFSDLRDGEGGPANDLGVCWPEYDERMYRWRERYRALFGG
jgi:hypothetical protein